MACQITNTFRMKLSPIIVFLTLLFVTIDLTAQDQTHDEYVFGAFNSGRIVNGQSTLNPTNGSLFFIISHQFGRINEGSYNFFGLDRSTIRLGFEYGINDFLGVGIGRSSMNKTFDAFVKLKFLHQKNGIKSVPINLSWYNNMAVNSLKWIDPEVEYTFKNRLAIVSQLLISRKFNSNFSLQLSPTYIKQNPVFSDQEDKNTFALGLSGRKKVSKKGSFVFEYFYLLPGYSADHYQNSLSLGFNIETLGHIFQIFLTNAQGLYENSFITHTNGKWQNGDIHLGFNIVREFQVKKLKSFRKK